MRVRGYNNAGSAVQTGLCAYRILKKKKHTHTHTHTHSPPPFRSTIVCPLVCHVTNHFMTDPKQNWLSYVPQDVDQTFKCRLYFFLYRHDRWSQGMYVHTCPILSTGFQWTKPGVQWSLVEEWNQKYSRVHSSYRKSSHKMKPEV